MAKKQYTNDMILDTAFELCAKVGLQGLSVRRLAAKLGCSVMPIYDAFDSREGLIDALHNYAIKRTFPIDGYSCYDDRCIALLEVAMEYPLFYIDMIRLNSSHNITGKYVNEFKTMMRNDPRTASLSLESMNQLNSTVEMQIMGMILWESTVLPIADKRRTILRNRLKDFIQRIIQSYI